MKRKRKSRKLKEGATHYELGSDIVLHVYRVICRIPSFGVEKEKLRPRTVSGEKPNSDEREGRLTPSFRSLPTKIDLCRETDRRPMGCRDGRDVFGRLPVRPRAGSLLASLQDECGSRVRRKTKDTSGGGGVGGEVFNRRTGTVAFGVKTYRTIKIFEVISPAGAIAMIL